MKKMISILCAISLLVGLLSGIAYGAAAAAEGDAEAKETLSCWWIPDWFDLAKGKEAVDLSTCYSYDAAGDTYTRTNNVGWQNYKVAFLYTEQTYNDFTLEFDVTFCEPVNQDSWVWIVSGSKNPADTLNADLENGASLTKLIYETGDNGKVISENWGNGRTDKWGDWLTGIGNDVSQSHHVKVVAKEGKYSVYLDNGVISEGWDLPNYTGGYIGIGTGNGTTTFSNISIEATNMDTLFGSYKAYRSTKVDNFYVGNTMQASSFAADWECSADDMIVRKDNGGTAAVYSTESYNDFEMEFDFTTGADDNTIYVGVGAAEAGGAWCEWTSLKDPSPTILRIHDVGVVQYAPTNEGKDFWFGNESGNLFTTDEAKKAVHKAKITVSDSQVTVYIDGNCQGTITMQNYAGGHIFLGGCTDKVSFSVPVIRKVSDSGSFASYYSDNVRFQDAAAKDLAEAELAKYWTEASGKITRKEVDGSIDVQDDLCVAELFLKDQKYTNFELNVDVTVGKSGWRRTFVGFGAEMGRHFQQSGGGTMIYLDGEYLRYGGCLDGANYYEGEWGGRHGEDLSKPVHLRIVVMNKTAVVYVGASDQVTSFSLADSYEGGYIYLASNSSGAVYENLTVEELKDEATDEFPEFAAYYSGNVRAGDAAAEDLAKVDAADHWMRVENSIVRKTVDGSIDVQDDLCVAELFLKDQKYTNFELNVDVTVGKSGWRRTFVGFGAEMGRHFQQSGGGTMIYLDGEYLRYGGCLDGTNYYEGEWGGRHGEDLSKPVHLRIVVMNMEVSVYVGDSKEPTTFTLPSDYTGGYIYLASNSTGAGYDNLLVQELTDDGNADNSSFERFASYYSDNIRFGDNLAVELTETAAANYWTAKDSAIIRKKTPAGDVQDDLYMAELFLKDQKYTNFELNVDVTVGKSGWQRAFVGFGAEMGRHFQQPGGGTMVYLDGGFLRYGGCLDGVSYEEGAWGKQHNMDLNKPVHIRLVVVGGNASVYVGDNTEPTTFSMPNSYKGGYIFLASNAQDATFDNLTVKNIADDSFNNFKSFSSYYTERVGAGGLQEAAPSQYWSELNGVITRRLENVPEDKSGAKWNETSFHLNNMAYLFLEGDYTGYSNYVIELDYKSGIGAWGRAYMGFGAAGVNTWREKNGGTVFFVDGGGATNFEGNLTANGTIDTDVFGTQLKEYSDKETHHLKLVCNGGIYNIYVDGIEVKTMVENKFNRGGRFFVASNSTATAFSNIQVTELPSDGASFAGYDEWYSKDISKIPLEDVPEGTNWSIINGVITRKAIEPELVDSLNKYDMAYLYLSEKKYTNFKVELDYKHGMSGWARAPIGFGAELGKSYMEADGGMITFAQPDGTVHIDGNIIRNGTFEENVFWPSYDENGKNLTTIAPYDGSQWHHITLEVMDGYAVVQFDDFPYLYEISIPSPYNGGYVYLCTNSAAAQYKNLKITDLSAVEDPAAQAGWQPTEEERSYDYSFREVAWDVIEWIYKKLKYFF